MTEQAVVSINEARQRCAADFKTFLTQAAKVDGHTPPDFHYIMADFLQSALPQWRAKKKCLLGFRLAAKSWIARQYVQWRWLRCPHMQFIIHSSSDDLAKAHVRSILRDLRQNPIVAHLSPDGKVSEHDFNLKNIQPEQGTSIRCAGINTSITGSRCDAYIFDDPESDVNPEAQHERILSAMYEATNILHSPRRHIRKIAGAKDVPIPERTQLITLGQPHCDNTVYLPLDDEPHPLRDARFMKIPAIDPHGNWTWPEMMEEKFFDHIRNRPLTVEEVRRSEVSTDMWHLQYMIDTNYAFGAGAVLKVHNRQPIEQTIDYPYMSIDPADSADKCEWGLAVGGRSGNNIHICYLGGESGDAYEGDLADETIGESTWHRIFGLCDMFGVREILLEKNLKSAYTACERFLRKTGRRMVVTPVTASTAKKTRIPRTLEQPVNTGIVTLSRQVMGDRDNMKQMTGLRWDRLPEPCDRIDAMSQLIGHLIESPTLTRDHSPSRRYSRPAGAVGELGRRGIGSKLVRIK